MSKGIAIGTEAASNLISKVSFTYIPAYNLSHSENVGIMSQGASKLRERIEPNEQPTEIPESVQKGVHVAKKATGMYTHTTNSFHFSLPCFFTV